MSTAPASRLPAVLTTTARATVRGLVTGFCWATALYGFIASSSFAYLQFIKPRVFGWVGTFADTHRLVTWAWLAGLLVLAAPHLRGRGRRRMPAIGLCGFCAALAFLSGAYDVIPALRDDGRSVSVGVLALLPMLWLALLDHLQGWMALRSQPGCGAGVHAERPRAAVGFGTDTSLPEGRLFVACLATAFVLTCGYAVLASVSVTGAFEPDLLASGLALGVGASLLGHLLVFAAVFVVLALSVRISHSLAVQYLLLLFAATLLFAGLFTRFVGDSIGLIGVRSQVAALVAGLTIAATWGGTRLAGHARRGARLSTGVDVFLSPAPVVAARPGGAAASGTADERRLRLAGRGALFATAAVLPIAWAFALVAGRIDWDYALLKSGVVIVWLITFALVYRASAVRIVPDAWLLVVFGLPLGVHAAWRPSQGQLHVLERYAVHNPSWLLTDRLLHERNQSRLFDKYLRTNTGLTDIQVAPVSIDLVDGPMAPAAEKPSIFLFVIDSLRADYLSPYNRDVHFTPRIAAFASDNTVFPNAFTRYGGTGLSMPAIWAGSALAHKQYVTPFDSMNSLQRLVDLNGYRRIQTRDHITDALWTHRPDDIELDRGRNEMDFDFCRTSDELGQTLEQSAFRETPVFVQTRSLNLHVAAVRNGYVPPDKHYPSTFEAPYAYRVERIDGCFGAFIDRLKRLDLYDRSIVILTADHGELIGEDGRWGHSYHMFPQVIQVPLFIHVPRNQQPSGVDSSAMALSTDITPTIYEALGYRVSRASPLAGQPLMTPGVSRREDDSRGGDAKATAAASGGPSQRGPSQGGRRQRESVSSASYGAVYAVVSRNGRRLFIADAIQEHQRLYRRESLSDLRWSEVPIDAGTRMLEELRIRRFIDTIARTYQFDRSF